MNEKEKFVDEWIKRVKKENLIIDEMNKQKLYELKIVKSEGGFPICPVCKEEFKNEDKLISHLIRSKNERRKLEQNYIGEAKVYLLSEIQKRKYEQWTEDDNKPKGRENPLSPKTRFEVLKRDNFTCQYCGRKSPDVILEVDHIEPYSKTRNNHPENLITSCKDCNRGKRTKEVVS